MSKFTTAPIGEGIETGPLPVPSPAGREYAPNSGVPGIGGIAPPAGELSSRRPLHGLPKFADWRMSNSNKRYWTDRQLSANAAKRRKGRRLTQMPSSRAARLSYGDSLNHKAHSQIWSAGANNGHQGPPLIDLEDVQGLAVDAASIRAVSSPQGLRHYPPIVPGDSTVQAGTEGPTGIGNSGPVLVSDHDGTIQRWFSIFKGVYKRIKGFKLGPLFRKGKNQG